MKQSRFCNHGLSGQPLCFYETDHSMDPPIDAKGAYIPANCQGGKSNPIDLPHNVRVSLRQNQRHPWAYMHCLCLS